MPSATAGSPGDPGDGHYARVRPAPTLGARPDRAHDEDRQPA